MLTRIILALSWHLSDALLARVFAAPHNARQQRPLLIVAAVQYLQRHYKNGWLSG